MTQHVFLLAHQETKMVCFPTDKAEAQSEEQNYED